MTSLVLHEYQGQIIEQRADGYVNLTQMAKVGGKKVSHYLELKSTDAYIEGLSSDTGIAASQLIQVTKGNFENGKEQGTWAFVEVAIDFAQWVSVPFRIWANRALRGILANTSQIINQPNAVEMSSFKALGHICTGIAEIGNAIQIVDYDVKKSANEIKASVAASTIETISEIRYASHSVSEQIKELKEIVQTNQVVIQVCSQTEQKQAPVAQSEYDRCRVNIRFKSEQYDAITFAASQQNKTVAQYCRDVVLQSVELQNAE